MRNLRNGANDGRRSSADVPCDISEPTPTCPVCGAECGWFFMNEQMDVVGCEKCVRRLPADENQWATVY